MSTFSREIVAIRVFESLPKQTMAATAISLHLRTTRPNLNPTFLHHFSSSSSSQPLPPNPNIEPKNSLPPNPLSSFSSYFSDVKANLRQNPPPPPPPPPRQQAASHDQILKGLSEFRRRTAAPTSEENLSPSPERFSFQKLSQHNVISKKGDSANQVDKSLSWKAISESVCQLSTNTTNTNQDPFSLKKYKDNFRLGPPQPRNPSSVIRSPRKFPESVFLKDLKEKKNGEKSEAMKTEFLKMYSYKVLGEKLRKPRPEGKPKDGFSLLELNERLVKLREMEERETASKSGGSLFMDLRHTLALLHTEKPKTIQKLDFLSYLGQTPAYMEPPPKEDLVEKYFHPDNMSSAEKLKIELQKVKDEFKMSESDCGSARVQVAQLTTKIKHLTTALHNKDTHSRKGLQGMIQQRKKLLKYLRRIEWESYTLVLSKFGLRDNPDQKRLPTKEKKKRKA